MWGAPRLWPCAMLKLIVVMTPGTPQQLGLGPGQRGRWGLGHRAVQVLSSTAMPGGCDRVNTIWAGAGLALSGLGKPTAVLGS